MLDKEEDAMNKENTTFVNKYPLLRYLTKKKETKSRTENSRGIESTWIGRSELPAEVWREFELSRALAVPYLAFKRR